MATIQVKKRAVTDAFNLIGLNQDGKLIHDPNATNQEFNPDSFALKPVVLSLASTATLKPNLSNNSFYSVSGLESGLFLDQPEGAIFDGQQLTIRVRDNGLQRAINYHLDYRAGSVAKPAATQPGRTMYLMFTYNAPDLKWDLTNVVSNIGSSTLLTGLVGYYKLNELSGPVLDELNNNNGTNNGGVAGVSGLIGNAYSFDGSGNITFAGNLFSTPAWSIGLSIYPTLVGEQTLFVTNGGSGGMHIRLGGTNFIDILKRGQFGVASSSQPIPKDTWSKIFVTQDAIGTYNFYRDGVAIGTSVNLVQFATGGNDMLANTNSGEGFHGKMDDFRVYERVLSPAEIADSFTQNYPF